MIQFIIIGALVLSLLLNAYLIVNRKKGSVDSLLKELEDKVKEKANYKEIKEKIKELKDKI